MPRTTPPSTLVAPLARRRTQLKEKSDPQTVAGGRKRTSDLANVPKGKEFKMALATGEGCTARRCAARRSDVHEFLPSYTGTCLCMKVMDRELGEAVYVGK